MGKYVKLSVLMDVKMMKVYYIYVSLTLGDANLVAKITLQV